MKKYIITLAGFLFGMTLKAQPSPRPGIISPEVHGENTVTFRFYAPQAKEIKLSAKKIFRQRSLLNFL